MSEDQIPLSSPDVDDSDIDAVTRVLRTPTLSLGPATEQFEGDLAAYAGCRHAVAVNSGTSGLHLGVIALGLKPDDEVITTPFSFVASVNCLLFEGVRPVLADIDPKTWDLDPEAVAAAITPRTRAILPVHVFGRPAPLAALTELAASKGLMLLEDSCESLGSTSDGRMTGTFGALGVYAFYPNKQMTTGEGGMIVTDDDDLAATCRSLSNQGRAADAEGWNHPVMGYNYRMSDIQAALGVSQLARLEDFIRRRQRVFDLYAVALADVPDLILPAPPREGDRVSWFVYVVRLADRCSRQDRDRVMGHLRQEGIGCRDYFQPIHLQPYMRRRFGTRRGDFPVTETVSDRTISLPFHNRLGADQVARVAGSLRRALAS